MWLAGTTIDTCSNAETPCYGKVPIRADVSRLSAAYPR
jgi:hypothetical protein